MTELHAAHRYARALYEVSREQQTLTRVREDLKTLSGLLQSLPQLERYCRRPGGGPEAQYEFIRIVCTPFMGDHCLRTVRTLVRNGRLAALPLLPAAFRYTEETLSDTVRVLVESARPLNDDLRAGLTKYMKKITGAEIRTETTITPRLLGGMIIWWKNYCLNLSVAGRLRQLKRTLAADLNQKDIR